MDCRSCDVVNAPGRRYCRECGARLGQPCAICHFFNAAEDRHCGGCGHRLQTGAASPAAAVATAPGYTPTDPGESPFPALGIRVPPVMASDPGIGGSGVSQSEIDGLFENILDEEPGEPAENDA